MFDATRIKHDFSKAALLYNEHALLQQRVLNELVKKAAPLIPANARILDAGCGTGLLGKLLPGAHITQMDISYPMCEQAAKNGKLTIVGNTESMPFAASGFDAVFSSLVLQWLPDWKSGVEELKRVLRPEGLIAVSTLGRNSLRELRRSFAEIDKHPHVSPFITPDAAWQKETITEYFPDFRSILHNLKVIGASNKLTTRRKGMMTKSQLQKVENFYHTHFADNSGLPVTWEVLYCVKRMDEI